MGLRGGGACRGVPGVTEGGTWSRKENKPSKSKPAFSRRGPDMCLVMQQPPHQPKLGLTEVIKRGSEGLGRGERRPIPSCFPESVKVRGRIYSLFRRLILNKSGYLSVPQNGRLFALYCLISQIYLTLTHHVLN